MVATEPFALGGTTNMHLATCCFRVDASTVHNGAALVARYESREASLRETEKATRRSSRVAGSQRVHPVTLNKPEPDRAEPIPWTGDDSEVTSDEAASDEDDTDELRQPLTPEDLRLALYDRGLETSGTKLLMLRRLNHYFEVATEQQTPQTTIQGSLDSGSGSSESDEEVQVTVM